METGGFIDLLLSAGIQSFSGVPCSYLKQLIEETQNRGLYLPFANEGDATAYAAGQALGGVPSAVLLQNAGLNNALSPLSSLTELFGIPVLLVIGNRGGEGDEPQHKLMGSATPRLLTLFGIPYFEADAPPEQWLPLLSKRTVALLVSKPLFAPTGKKTVRPDSDGFLRYDVLRRVAANCRGALVLSTTGYTSRELYALGDRPGHFYMVGSMGCLSSLALGVARANPQKPVIAIDGDGGCAMRLGALATVAGCAPGNLLYMVLDNRGYESTGGQPCALTEPRLAPLLEAFHATQAVRRLDEIDRLIQTFCQNPDGYRQVYVPILMRTIDGLPRPDRRMILSQASRFAKAVWE